MEARQEALLQPGQGIVRGAAQGKRTPRRGLFKRNFRPVRDAILLKRPHAEVRRFGPLLTSDTPGDPILTRLPHPSSPQHFDAEDLDSEHQHDGGVARVWVEAAGAAAGLGMAL